MATHTNTNRRTFETRAARAAYIATLPASTVYRLKKRTGAYTQPGRGITSVYEFIVETEVTA